MYKSLKNLGLATGLTLALASSAFGDNHEVNWVNSFQDRFDREYSQIRTKEDAELYVKSGVSQLRRYYWNRVLNDQSFSDNELRAVVDIADKVIVRCKEVDKKYNLDSSFCPEEIGQVKEKAERRLSYGYKKQKQMIGDSLRMLEKERSVIEGERR